MNTFLSIVSAVFWGLLVLSLLVFIHEGGHFLAARVFGIRVKEFYLGLPCRWRLHHASKKTGTDYGVTPLLLGGYTLVSGMEESSQKELAPVLAYIQKHGICSHQEIAKELNMDEDIVLSALATLNDWASIEECPTSEKTCEAKMPTLVQTLERDEHLLTKYDKAHNFSEIGTTKAGVSRVPDMSPEEFLESEKKHTYLSQGFFGRFLILVAGAVINIVFGYLLIVFVLSVLGTSHVVDSNTIGAVEQGSLAEQAGLVAGDTITSINGVDTSTWNEVVQALSIPLQNKNTISIIYVHKGESILKEVSPTKAGEKLGISAQTETVRLSVGEAFVQAWNYIITTFAYILQLFQPDKFVNVISNSTSVVGISVMASSAAASGVSSILMLVAAVSLSLGFMNLLPIPPLDGGKVVIEAVQALIRRPLPRKAINIISYFGIAVFLVLFIVLLYQDILRFILGG